MKRLFIFSLAALTACSILTNAGAEVADENADGLNDERARRHRLNLSEEQRQQISQLKESGATKEEIRTAVQTFKEANGGGKGKRPGRGRGPRLSEEQRLQISELKEGGASKEEIRATMQAFKEANGSAAAKDPGAAGDPAGGTKACNAGAAS